MTVVRDQPVWDERKKLEGKPGFHALIAGVSHYQHLPGGDAAKHGALIENGYGMQQLSSTARTSYKIYRWLLDRKDQLPLKLATVRLLLSPSRAELAAEPEMKELIETKPVSPCNREAFQAAVIGWRKDAKSSRKGFTFFYFAGHGMQRRSNDTVLLLEDFGNPANPVALANAVSFRELFDGMVPPPNNLVEEIALRQIYFIDACRITPEAWYAFESKSPLPFWESDPGGRDDRSAPVFFAAIPGAEAYALAGNQTLFSQALLSCLDGAAGDTLDDEETDNEGKPRWGVRVYSLADALRFQIEELNKELGVNLDYSRPTGQVGNDTLHYLDGPPEFDARFMVDPTDALPFVRLEVIDLEEPEAWSVEPPLDPHPYIRKLRAGYYRIKATVEPPNPPYENRSRPAKVKPPRPILMRVV